MRTRKTTFVRNLKDEKNFFLCRSLASFCREIGTNEQTFRNWLSRNELNFKADSFYYKGYWICQIDEILNEPRKKNINSLRNLKK